MNWTVHANETLRMFLENMVNEGRLSQTYGIAATPAQVVDASEEALRDVIQRSLPLARIMDASDLVLHAEGPAVRDDSPRLAAFNWLAGTAERAIRKLSGTLFDLLERDVRRFERALDLRITGMAPGSLYLGFAIAPPEADLIAASDEPVFDRIREAVHRLPALSGAIDENAVSAEAQEIVPDAAERDAAFMALHRMAPTGRVGIHTLDMTSPGSPRGTLSQRERVVLHDALRRPLLNNRKPGAFAGEVREIDLDAQRMHLRGVAGIGSLRCVLPALDREQAKLLLGEFVRVSGEYEADRQGRPRLMIAERFESLPRSAQRTIELVQPST